MADQIDWQSRAERAEKAQEEMRIVLLEMSNCPFEHFNTLHSCSCASHAERILVVARGETIQTYDKNPDPIVKRLIYGDIENASLELLGSHCPTNEQYNKLDTEQSTRIGCAATLQAWLNETRTTERDDWQARAERAEKACAEMRAALLATEWASDGCFRCEICEGLHPNHREGCLVHHALSTDCGEGYVRREELDAAEAEVEMLRKISYPA